MSKQPTRRHFHKAIATAGVTSCFCTGGDFLLADAQEEEGAKSHQAAAKSLLEIVRARYGKHLNAAQLKEIERSIHINLYFASKLDEAKLSNGDEPAFVFSADVRPSS